MSFRDAGQAMEEALAGPVRGRIVDEVSRAKNLERALFRLRDAMRGHRFDTRDGPLSLDKLVKRLDHRARADGFHALNDWDGKADRFCDDIIPAELANFARQLPIRADGPAPRLALAVLLDYYFLYVLSLVALHAWDEGDANANLDEVTRLLDRLQGERGGGQPFVRDAATLILVATSHFEPDVAAYDRLRERVRMLDEAHRLGFALAHAPILGSHLRFGLEVTCGGDVRALRDDNVPDYPWLCASLVTLAEAYERTIEDRGDGAGHNAIVEALLCGLTPDPRAFVGSHPPASLAGCEDERSRLREIVDAHRGGLIEDFQAHRPAANAYSPLSFSFNFPHNLVKGIVVNALLRGAPWPLSLNDLLTAFPGGETIDSSRRSLATTLMGYALSSPDTIRGRPHPAIVYDPSAGDRAFEKTIRSLRA